MEIGIVTAYMIQISWWEVTNIYMEEVSPKIKKVKSKMPFEGKFLGNLLPILVKIQYMYLHLKYLFQSEKKPNERLNI